MKTHVNNLRHRQLRQLRQSGVASLMVTMVMMIVISLIVLGFAQISRREQTNSLNRQLSTQAFYAAETGINDAQNAINAAAANGTAITPKTGCTDNGNSTSIYYGKINYIVNSAQGVTYTCLLVSTQVSQLQKTLGVDQEWVVPIHPVDGSGADSPLPLGQLKFSWPPQPLMAISRILRQTPGIVDMVPSGSILFQYQPVQIRPARALRPTTWLSLHTHLQLGRHITTRMGLTPQVTHIRHMLPATQGALRPACSR
jgi:Tfp pilus assembly protein PilX